MTWLALLRLILSIADTVSNYVREKQLLDAGAASEIARNLAVSLALVDQARRARDAAGADFDKRNGVPDENDPNLRD